MRSLVVTKPSNKLKTRIDMKPLDIIRNGIITENPTFVLLLGMCPTLATTSSASNGLAMGLATMFVLICANTAISLIKNLAAKNGVAHSALDGVGIGLGFTCSLTLLGMVRELLGTGKFFGMTIFPEHYGALLFVLAPGAFVVLGYLIAISNVIKKK